MVSFQSFTFVLFDQVNPGMCQHWLLIVSPSSLSFQLAPWEISCCAILDKTPCFWSRVLFMLTHKKDLQAVLPSVENNSISAPICCHVLLLPRWVGQMTLSFILLPCWEVGRHLSTQNDTPEAKLSQLKRQIELMHLLSDSSVAFASILVANAWDVFLSSD